MQAESKSTTWTAENFSDLRQSGRSLKWMLIGLIRANLKASLLLTAKDRWNE